MRYRKYGWIIPLAALMLTGCGSMNMNVGKENRNQAHVIGTAMDVCESILDDTLAVMGCTVTLKVIGADEYIELFAPYASAAYNKMMGVSAGDKIRAEAAIQGSGKLTAKSASVKER